MTTTPTTTAPLTRDDAASPRMGNVTGSEFVVDGGRVKAM
jgi:hypothetical protein